MENPDEDVEETCVGNVPFLNEGEYVCVRGELVTHPIYQEQLKVMSCEVQEPDDELAMLRYLSSGAIAGVRGGLEKRIVDKFGDKTFEIIEKEPERLAEVKGITEKACNFRAVWEEKEKMRGAMLSYRSMEFQMHSCRKIYQTYGSALYEIVRENPYRMAEDISGVGFRIADEIARKKRLCDGLCTENPCRYFLYVLNAGTKEGYVYMPEKLLFTGGGLSAWCVDGTADGFFRRIGL